MFGSAYSVDGDSGVGLEVPTALVVILVSSVFKGW